MTTFQKSIAQGFHVITCCGCHADFAINDSLERRSRVQHLQSIYCPSCGTTLSWGGKTNAQKKIDRLEASLELARSNSEYHQQEATDAQNKLRATKGVVTRMKNRAKNGVCPCCNRTFKNLQRHMKSQHPEFGEAKS